MRATQHYWNSYNERGQAVQVPRLTLVRDRIDRMPTAYEKQQAREAAFSLVKKGAKWAGAAILVGGLIGLIYIHVGPWGFVAISAAYLVGHFFGKAERHE